MLRRPQDIGGAPEAKWVIYENLDNAGGVSLSILRNVFRDHAESTGDFLDGLVKEGLAGFDSTEMRLTPAGRSRARDELRRLRACEMMVARQSGVLWTDVRRLAAERVDSLSSESAFDFLRSIGYPEVGLFGHPIPYLKHGGRGSFGVHEGSQPLDETSMTGPVQVTQLNSWSSSILQCFLESGITPGSTLIIKKSRQADGVIELESLARNEGPFSIGGQVAAEIYVKDAHVGATEIGQAREIIGQVAYGIAHQA